MKYVILTLFFLVFCYEISAQFQNIPYRVGDKWGFSDYYGKIEIEPKFDSLGFFVQYKSRSSKIAIAQLKGKFGLIDKSGEFVVPPKYEIIKPEDYFVRTHNVEKFIVQKKNKFGIINLSNEPVVSVKYDTLFADLSIKHGAGYFAKIGSKYFVIDKEGLSSEISQSDYQSILETDIAVEDPYPDKMESPERWRSDYMKFIGMHIDSISEVKSMNGLYHFLFYVDGKVGAVHQSLVNERKRNYFIFPKYDEIVKPALGEARDSRRRKCYYFLVKKDGKIGVIDREGKVKMSFVDYEYHFFNGYFTITKKDGLYGFYKHASHYNDVSGNIAPMYEEILPVLYDNPKYLINVKKNGKWGYVNINGREYFQD